MILYDSPWFIRTFRSSLKSPGMCHETFRGMLSDSLRFFDITPGVDDQTEGGWKKGRREG